MVYQKIPPVNDFRPLKNNDCYFIGAYNNIREVYFAINDHWINCYTKVIRSIQFEYKAPIAFVWFHSDANNWYYKRLYAINNQRLINQHYDKNTTSFVVTKDLFVIPITK